MYYISMLISGGGGYYANQEEDFIFEDFARLRMKENEGADIDA